jgi:hypothetical protein
MGSGLESHCVGRVYGADGAVRLAPYTRPKQWGAKLNVSICIKIVKKKYQTFLSTRHESETFSRTHDTTFREVTIQLQNLLFLT